MSRQSRKRLRFLNPKPLSSPDFNAAQVFKIGFSGKCWLGSFSPSLSYSSLGSSPEPHASLLHSTLHSAEWRRKGSHQMPIG